jgi:hypothetical protein
MSNSSKAVGIPPVSLNLAFVQRFFEGKTVALVGPANDLIGTGVGAFIDSHDIVCRLNDSFIIDEGRVVDYGRRCDALLNTCNTELLCIMSRFAHYLDGCRLIINPTSRIHKQDWQLTNQSVEENYRDTGLPIPFYQVEGEIESLMTVRGLNTGMCALTFLAGLGLKTLHIEGFSFHGVKEREYTNGAKVYGYETYLFDYKNVYTCKTDCPPDAPCRRRHDPRVLDRLDEIKQLKFFQQKIACKENFSISQSIQTLISKEDSYWARVKGLFSSESL